MPVERNASCTVLGILESSPSEMPGKSDARTRHDRKDILTSEVLALVKLFFVGRRLKSPSTVFVGCSVTMNFPPRHAGWHICPAHRVLRRRRPRRSQAWADRHSITIPLLRKWHVGAYRPRSDSTLQPGIQIEIRCKGIDKAHAFQHTAAIEIFAENHRHLIQAGGCPDLRRNMTDHNHAHHAGPQARP